ncbi:unnamed protein product [Zymoseptoria tritici ST99CH_3D1]|nr:unnamed protein product [Zymoseptoria tritici ST99CH_3D1]
MSDLGGGAGRATNGGARTGGPVPVSGGTPVGIRTPRDVMRDRNAREARRQQEAQREEELRLRQAEERRKSAERRAPTVAGGVPRFSGASAQYNQDVTAPPGGFDGGDDRRQSRIPGEVAGTNVLGEPIGRASMDNPNTRTRGSGMSQTDQARAATVGATRRTQPSQTAARQPTVAANAGPSTIPSTQASAGEAARNTTSSFPHAFERWETLSSHWEGLTSYWLHKLEQNTEEIREAVPNASTLNRQITDLSAAGANLFHAVVELQRLRASSERKFQRWFFETRADNERSREQQANLEKALNEERASRDAIIRSQSDNSATIENAKREVSEMRRELMISKDEARRAWEELGRRNQESLDTAQSLKEGRVTIVSGVQVVPYFAHPSRTGSASLAGRPATRDGQQGYSTGGMTSMGGDEREYYRDQTVSPTQTDPFTDSGRQRQPPLHHEPGVTALGETVHQPYSTGAGASSASQHPQNTPDQRAHGASITIPVSATEAQQFYHQPQTSTHDLPGSNPAQSAHRSHSTYDDDYSENPTEYIIDSAGTFQRDAQGRPIVYQGPAHQRSHQQQQQHQPVSPEESEDDFDTEADVRREQEHAARYGAGGNTQSMIPPPEAPSVPATSAQAMQGYEATAGAGEEEDEDGERPDYEGEGFEGYQQYVPRHHHPTRLSDVLEEEEERSSRRTGGD